MQLTLHPRVAPAGTGRVWLGCFGATRAPDLAWSVDGAPAAPVALRSLASVRPPELVAADQRRVFAGLYEFPGLSPGLHRVEVRVAGEEPARVELPVMPPRVPQGINEWFHVLLVSCFHSVEDPGGTAGRVVDEIRRQFHPHLTLLLGDQVYLDLPTLQDFKDDEVWLAENFEAKYAANWLGTQGYSRVLAAAPSVAIPDDHEFWNNFPHPSPFIQNSWSEDGRSRWGKISRLMFEAFQLHEPGTLGRAVEVDIEPLSFFFADTRTFRDPGLACALNQDTLVQLKAWAARLRQQRRMGIFVTGQSLLDAPSKGLSAQVGDRTLANYGDHPDIVATLADLSRKGWPLLCVTGDVHWGRVAAGRRLGSGRATLYEVICSPASLVSTIGADQLKSIGAAIGGLFGKKDPFPRHSETKDPPGKFRLGDDTLGFTRRYPLDGVHPLKGNQVAMLSFSRIGDTALQLRIRYWLLDPKKSYQPPVVLDDIKLVFDP